MSAIRIALTFTVPYVGCIVCDRAPVGDIIIK